MTFHRDKPYGIVDFALTNPAYDALASRLKDTGTGISYAAPRAGGRTKPDGTELKWKVSFPEGVERGKVPFWCEDVTPRERRVPGTESGTRHPSGVKGMKGMVVRVPGEGEEVGRAMGAITDSSALSAEEGGGGWAVGVPRAGEGLEGPKIWVKGGGEMLLTLVLQGWERREIVEKIGEEGLVSIVFE